MNENYGAVFGHPLAIRQLLVKRNLFLGQSRIDGFLFRVFFPVDRGTGRYRRFVRMSRAAG